jgi:eukaryotic-like serine/threonine-protein kinase
VYLASIDNPESRTKILDSDSTNVLYSLGHLLFLRGSTLMAQSFDASSLKVTGDVFPVAEHVRTQSIGGNFSGIFSASQTGLLLFETGSAQSNESQLVWVDRAGRELAKLGPPAQYADVQLSPDGRQASVTVIDRQSGAQGRGDVRGVADIWLFDLARGIRTRLTSDTAGDYSAIWSPDSTRVVFASSRVGPGDLYQRMANGSGADQVLLADAMLKVPVGWSADGKYIVYIVTRPATGRRGPAPAINANSSGGANRALWALPLFGDRKPFQVLESTSLGAYGQLSPDGRWIAYGTMDSGRPEVYVTSFPKPGAKTQISSSGGTHPRWRADGKEIFYRGSNPETQMMAAAMRAKDDAIEVIGVTSLFDFAAAPIRYPFDVAKDGERFLLNTYGLSPDPVASSSPMTVVVNWLTAAGRER